MAGSLNKPGNRGKGRGKKRPGKKLRRNVRAGRAEDKFNTTVKREQGNLNSWREKHGQAKSNGRRLDRIRAERMMITMQARILTARRELLEFALTVQWPGRIRELAECVVRSKKQARTELGQIGIEMENCGSQVKRLYIQEKRSLPLIDPHPIPAVRLGQYDSLIGELEAQTKKKRFATVATKDPRKMQASLIAQEEKLELELVISIAKTERLRLLLGHANLRKSRGFKTKADARKALRVEVARIESANETLTGIKLQLEMIAKSKRRQ